MNPNISAALIALVVAAGTSLLVVNMGPQPKRTLHVTSTAAQTTVMRLAADQWPEIEQKEIDALTAALKNVPKEARRDVLILCHSDTRCGDLALNLENSFESAHWTVERKLIPLPDGYRGLMVNDEAMRKLLAGATTLQPVRTDEPVAGGGIGIIIGSKPRG